MLRDYETNHRFCANQQAPTPAGGGISSVFIFGPPFFASLSMNDAYRITKWLAKNEGRKIGTPETKRTNDMEAGTSCLVPHAGAPVFDKIASPWSRENRTLTSSATSMAERPACPPLRIICWSVAINVLPVIRAGAATPKGRKRCGTPSKRKSKRSDSARSSEPTQPAVSINASTVRVSRFTLRASSTVTSKSKMFRGSSKKQSCTIEFWTIC